jgi:hypothetical protein
MDLKKIYQKPSRRVVLKAETVDGKLKRIRCCVHVDADNISAIDDAINDLTKYKQEIEARYNN